MGIKNFYNKFYKQFAEEEYVPISSQTNLILIDVSVYWMKFLKLYPNLNSEYCELNFLRFVLNNIISKIFSPTHSQSELIEIKLIIDNDVARRIEKWNCCLKRLVQLTQIPNMYSNYKLNFETLKQMLNVLNEQLILKNIKMDCLMAEFDADRVIYDEIYSRQNQIYNIIVLSIDSDFLIFRNPKIIILDFNINQNMLIKKNTSNLECDSQHSMLWMIGILMPNDFKSYNMYNDDLYDQVFKNIKYENEEYWILFNLFLDYLFLWVSKLSKYKQINFICSILYNCCIDPFCDNKLYIFMSKVSDKTISVDFDFFKSIIHNYIDDFERNIIENEKKFKRLCKLPSIIDYIYIKDLIQNFKMDIKICKMLFFFIKRIFFAFYPNNFYSSISCILDSTNEHENEHFTKFFDYFNKIF